MLWYWLLVGGMVVLALGIVAFWLGTLFADKIREIYQNRGE